MHTQQPRRCGPSSGTSCLKTFSINTGDTPTTRRPTTTMKYTIRYVILMFPVFSRRDFFDWNIFDASHFQALWSLEGKVALMGVSHCQSMAYLPQREVPRTVLQENITERWITTRMSWLSSLRNFRTASPTTSAKSTAHL